MIWNNALKKHNFTIILLYFLCAMICLLLTLCKNFKKFQKNVSIQRMDEKKIHTREFQLKGIIRNMRCKLLQKRSTGKTESSKHLQNIAIEKDIFLELNRCIFQISLKYIKLVISKILFILGLCSFNFYFKITWTPNNITHLHQHKNISQRLFWNF